MPPAFGATIMDTINTAATDAACKFCSAVSEAIQPHLPAIAGFAAGAATVIGGYFSTPYIRSGFGRLRGGAKPAEAGEQPASAG